MAGIKSALVKRTARNLMQSDIQFNEDFNSNKKLLVGTMPSKTIRNKIAGYIVRLRKQQRIAKISLEK
jgi:ribosomal protein S17E